MDLNQHRRPAPRRVNLELFEQRTGETKHRSIDISNLLVHSGATSEVAATSWHQRELIKQWIAERGERQHNSPLRLVSFYLSP